MNDGSHDTGMFYRTLKTSYNQQTTKDSNGPYIHKGPIVTQTKNLMVQSVTSLMLTTRTVGEFLSLFFCFFSIETPK